ncbi:MAG: recombinase RecT [Candidatus Absconditabacterales bacterium]|nr:recombinase RecT [Candidatus Absconditabacterales bacterium]
MSKEIKKETTVSKQNVVEKPKHQIIEFEKNISDSVQNKVTQLVKDGRLDLPSDYSIGNAVSSAWLVLQSVTVKGGALALDVCTKHSIANALLDMVILGHNPVKHGYFIAYGNKLTWFPSYLGKSASLKRLKGFEREPIATLIYENDELSFDHNELGEERITNHVSSWKNKLSGKIVGAYATVKQGDIVRSAVMTMAEIKEAWTKNPSPNNRRDHTEFTGEFSKRTVINRLIKTILKTSNDDNLLADTLLENEEKHYVFDNGKDYIEAEEVKVREKVKADANTGEVIDVDEIAEEIAKDEIVEDEKVATPDEAPWG